MNPTDIVIVDSTGPSPPASFMEEVNTIVARYVRTKVVPGVTTLAIAHQLEEAGKRWYPDQKVFALCEFDMVTRDAPTQIWHPRFRHDCEACEFLGRWVGTEDHPEAEVDLYTCTKGTGLTYIARFGDAGPDYTSGAGFTSVIRSLGEARRRHMLRDG